MWVILNNSALSIVRDRADTGNLLVRSRFNGDIERVFPGADVKVTPDADYLFRAFVPADEVAFAIAERALDIDYTDFKGSVDDRDRHDVYFGVWRVLQDAQVRGRIRPVA